jgi:hypothetical protein
LNVPMTPMAALRFRGLDCCGCSTALSLRVMLTHGG